MNTKNIVLSTLVLLVLFSSTTLAWGRCTAPVVNIVNAQVINEDQITATAHASWTGSGNCKKFYAWWSIDGDTHNICGRFGCYGLGKASSWTTDHLSPGTHVISFHIQQAASGTCRQSGVDSRTLNVGPGSPPPEPEQNINPIAGFNVQCDGLTCQFIDTSYDVDGNVVAWEWFFETGGQSNDRDPTFTFPADGTYNVLLRVTDDDSAQDTYNTDVTVADGAPTQNNPPTADFAFVCDANDICQFTDASTDPEFNIVTWFWDFGDGFQAQQINPMHAFMADGIYNVELIVTDALGLTDNVIYTVNIPDNGNPPPQPGDPTAAFTITPQTGDTNTVFTFTDNSITDGTEAITNWAWDFGDGATSTATSPTHQYAAAAGYTITLTVTDQGGQTNTIGLPLTVTTPGTPGDEMPIALAGQDQTVYEDNEFTIYGSGTDPDGGDIALYEWDFNQDDSVYDLAVGQTATVDGYTVELTALNEVTAGVFEAQFQVSWPDGSTAVTSNWLGDGIEQVFDSNKMTLFVNMVDNDSAQIRIYAYDYVSASTGEVNHIYNNIGTYVAVLRVTDDEGNTDTDFVIMTVTARPSSLMPTANAGADQTVTPAQVVTFIGTGSDMDGNVVLYEWDFDGDGVYDWSSTTTGTTTHSYATTGTYVARLRVTDNDGLTSIDTAVLYVTDSGTIAPTAYAGTDKDAETGDWLSFVGAGTDTDGYIVLYEWDFSYVTLDGFDADWSSTATGVTTHRYTRAGVYVAALRVTDNDGSTNIDLVTVDISGPDVDDDEETSGSESYDFHLHALDVYRTYDYDADEAVTTIKFRVTNLLGEQRSFLVRDIVPKDFAKYVDDFDINPQPDYIYNMDPEIGWNITLGDHESFLITYEFEKYINISDFEDWAAPVITEYDIPEADTEDEGEDTTGNFTGMVFGAFATPWFGLIAFIIIIVLVIAFWKRDYIVQKWNSWSESE